jgi:hypothetical protein
LRYLLVAAALAACAGLAWLAWRVWQWLPLSSAQKLLLLLAMPVSWLGVVALAQGEWREDAALPLLAIPGIVIGVLVAGAARLVRMPAGVLAWIGVSAILMVGFGAPWTREAIEDGLFHKRSMTPRSFVVHSRAGDLTINVPRAFLARRNTRVDGEVPLFDQTLRLEIDGRTMQPWPRDVWQWLEAGMSLPEERFRVRAGISIDAECPAFRRKEGPYNIHCEYERIGARREAATASEQLWFTACGPPTKCGRWPIHPDRPVLVVYSFDADSPLDIAQLDLRIAQLLRSFSIPIEP